MRRSAHCFAGFVSALFLLACTQKMGREGHLRPDTVAREQPEGTLAQEQYRAEKRPEITRALLKRGQERFTIYCSPCHGTSGSGNGPIIERGFIPPPSFHSDRLRKVPDSHIYDVISRGFGAMASYSDRVSANDRWAIVSFVRALQLSQNCEVSKLSMEERKKFPPMTGGAS